MGYLHVLYLESEQLYICHNCKTHLSELNEIVSKEFRGKHGSAFLFNKVINILQGPLEDRNLSTGLHTVCDIYCISCQAYLGWKYERAYDTDQKYKEGRYILERALIKKIK